MNKSNVNMIICLVSPLYFVPSQVNVTYSFFLIKKKKQNFHKIKSEDVCVYKKVAKQNAMHGF